MKYLQDYVEEKQTAVFDTYGVFFAFSEKQLGEGLKKNKENKKVLPGEKHTRFPAGMFCPSKHADAVNDELTKIGENAIKEDTAENTKEGVIKRELYNHEAFYTGDIESTVESLENYGITEKEVRIVYYTELPNADNNF